MTPRRNPNLQSPIANRPSRRKTPLQILRKPVSEEEEENDKPSKEEEENKPSNEEEDPASNDNPDEPDVAPEVDLDESNNGGNAEAAVEEEGDIFLPL